MRRMPKKERMRVEEQAEWFARQVKDVNASATEVNKAPVTVRLAQFRGDVFRLYECLWYADTAGVSVTFIPSGSRRAN